MLGASTEAAKDGFNQCRAKNRKSGLRCANVTVDALSDFCDFHGDDPATEYFPGLEHPDLVPAPQGSQDLEPVNSNPLGDSPAELGSREEDTVAVKVLRRPEEPSAAEIAEHQATHSPYRDWCPSCVAGGGRSLAHRHQEKDPDPSVPTIAMYYGFLGKEDAREEDLEKEGSSPMLVTKDTKQRWRSANMLVSKGTAHSWSEQVLEKELSGFGYPRMCLKSDQEKALLSLKKIVGERVKAGHSTTTTYEEPPVEESQSNGFIEVAVKEVKGLIRTLRHAVENTYGTKVPVDHPVMVWMAPHAAAIINRTKKGTDGKTAWELRKGRPYRKALVPFAEKVLFLPAGKRNQSRAVAKFQMGIFLGLQDNSDEMVVGTPKGVVKARTVKRLSTETARDPEFLLSVKGVPWCPIPGEPNNTEVRTRIDPLPVEDLLPVGPREPVVDKAVYIRRDVELKEYGLTEGCAGCAVAKFGNRAVAHSQRCRDRIETAMAEDEAGKARIDDTMARNAKRLKKAIEDRGLVPVSDQPEKPDEAARSSKDQVVEEPNPPSGEVVMEDTTNEETTIPVIPERRSAASTGVPEDVEGPPAPKLLKTNDEQAVATGTGPTQLSSSSSPMEDISELAPLGSCLMDLRGRDLSRRPVVDKIKQEIMELAPQVLITNVPSTASGGEITQKGKCHVIGCMELAAMQRREGRRFVHVAKTGSWSWGQSQSIALLMERDVDSKNVETGNSMMTNSEPIVNWVSSGQRKSDRGFLGAVKEDFIQSGRLEHSEWGPTAEEQEFLSSITAEEFYDCITGVMLDAGLVRQAREDGMSYVKKLKVWDVVSTEMCWKLTNAPPIGVRWLDLNKGDWERPFYRSSLVAQETKRVSSLGVNNPAEVFAATPPTESLRFLCSLMMSCEEVRREEKLVMGFFDISRAHFHSPCLRDVFIRLPDEDPEKMEGLCGKLRQSMYGTRDAAQNFDRKSEDAMESMGFEVGLYNPCLYWHPVKKARVVRHGDDFICLATRAVVQWFYEELGKILLVKQRGVLGPEKSLGDVSEITCLNRIIRLVSCDASGQEYIEWEPDLRHVEILVSQMGMKSSSNSLSCPGQKEQPDYTSEALHEDRKSVFRSATMRISHLAQDRMDISLESKEVARRMQDPDEQAWSALKRCVRYLIKKPRVLLRFNKQRWPRRIIVYSDSDHAGCLRTRRSTSCVCVLVGDHFIVGTSTTQVPVALSSGESEYYALAKAMSRGLGAKSMAKGLGVHLEVTTRCDGTAAKGIAARRGAGKLRHVDTQSFWGQRAVYNKQIHLEKCEGTKNPADMGTKFLPGPSLEKFASALGFKEKQGSSALGLKAAL